jgi:hypothetical protein
MTSAKRLAVSLLLTLFAVAASAAILVFAYLGDMMRPRPPASELAYTIAPFAILILALVAIVAAFRRAAPRTIAGLAALIVLAGLTPPMVDTSARVAIQKQAESEDVAYATAFLAELARRRADIDARAAEHRAYTPEEMLDLVTFAGSADLTWRGGADHTPEAFALLETALAAGLVDPDARLDHPPVEKYAGAPLVLYVYDINVLPVRPRNIKASDWDLVTLLARDADLTLPEAAELKADLAKKPVPTVGRFIALE